MHDFMLFCDCPTWAVNASTWDTQALCDNRTPSLRKFKSSCEFRVLQARKVERGFCRVLETARDFRLHSLVFYLAVTLPLFLGSYVLRDLETVVQRHVCSSLLLVIGTAYVLFASRPIGGILSLLT